MRFPYLSKQSKTSIYSLGGGSTLYFPVFAITVIAGRRLAIADGLVDSAANDTVFPVTVAQTLGLDLTNAPFGRAAQAGGIARTYRYAHVELYLSDGKEAYRWPAIVGFLNAPGKRHALLGHAGFLDFFDVLLRGAAKETVVDPNSAFPGQRIYP